MNTNIDRRFTCELSISSFRFNLININNSIEVDNRNEFNNFEEINFFMRKSDNIYDDEIAKNCKINTWREEYFPFLALNIEDPNKTEKIT